VDGTAIGASTASTAKFTTLGRAVQVDPIKHMLKAPETKRLKPEYE
jgi:hypothetical protein